MLSYAVVGASRGIGLEYVRQLASRSETVVFAIVRNPAGSTYLQAAAANLKNVHIIAGDVAEHSTLERVVKQVADVTGGKLDYLIHNAASLDPGTLFKHFDGYANMDELDNEFIAAYRVNSLGPIHSITAFLPLLRASSTKNIIVIGSGGGNPKTVLAFGIANMGAYGMTKAAAVIATTKFAIQLKDEGFVVITLDPGMVNTTATAPDKDAFKGKFRASMKETGIQFMVQTPDEAVAAQLKVIDGLEASHNGLYLSHTGEEYRAPC